MRELAAGVSPACSQHNIAAAGQFLEPVIAVDMEYHVEVRQMGGRPIRRVAYNPGTMVGAAIVSSCFQRNSRRGSMPHFLATPETDALWRPASSTIRLLSASPKFRRDPPDLAEGI